MEYVDGEDLAALLQRIGRLPSDKALEIARKLCAGLAAAHERGVIHRDLKPQNIMLDKRGQVVIMDFGLAAVASSLRGPEARNGTPAYMSPEQLRGESVSAKSDLYALGLIFYELFTRRRAFDASSVAELVTMQESARPASMTAIASDIDPAVERVIQRCLRPDAAERPATALAIAAALPGGDPLAAALAAGETPSPELVAASGHTEGFSLKYAIPCLAFVVLALIAYPFLMAPLSLLPATPMEYPPAVLEHKAREFAAGFGYRDKPVDRFSYFDWNRGLIRFLRAKPGTNKDWARFFAAESPVTYNYRQSQDYLLAPPDGDISMDRPAPTAPGRISIVLDSQGRLRSFRAVAPRFDDGAATTQDIDQASLFRAAGYDRAQFQESAPRLVPAVPFDRRVAWKGAVHGLPAVDITLEAAYWHGKLANFAVLWPWDKSDSGGGATTAKYQVALEIFTCLFITLSIVSAIYMARRNLARGRGDRAGAYRLAVFEFASFVFFTTVGYHFIPRTDMIGYLSLNIAGALTLAMLLWTLYIALEPAVRARWPHSLITWNRLLAGQFGDARLGSHILTGTVLGVAMRYAFIWRQQVIVANGGSQDGTDLDLILGVRPMASNLGNRMFSAVLAGVAIFFLLIGLRALLRRDWLAAPAAGLLLALQDSDWHTSTHIWLDLSIKLAVYCGVAFVLLRMGLVPAIVGLFVVNVLGNMPLSADLSSWYNAVTVFEMGMVAAIAVYGFWRSQTQSSVPRL
jgi:serine/threonine-protein kinase